MRFRISVFFDEILERETASQTISLASLFLALRFHQLTTICRICLRPLVKFDSPILENQLANQIVRTMGENNKWESDDLFKGIIVSPSLRGLRKQSVAI